MQSNTQTGRSGERSCSPLLSLVRVAIFAGKLANHVRNPYQEEKTV